MATKRVVSGCSTKFDDKEFHAVGLATENELSAKRLYVRGTKYKVHCQLVFFQGFICFNCFHWSLHVTYCLRLKLLNLLSVWAIFPLLFC